MTYLTTTPCINPNSLLALGFEKSVVRSDDSEAKTFYFTQNLSEDTQIIVSMGYLGSSLIDTVVEIVLDENVSDIVPVANTHELAMLCALWGADLETYLESRHIDIQIHHGSDSVRFEMQSNDIKLSVMNFILHFARNRYPEYEKVSMVKYYGHSFTLILRK